MNRKSTCIIAAVLGGFLAVNIGLGQEASAEHPAHNELRQLRTQIIDAIESGDLDGVIPHVHPNVVVTWQTHEVCRGHDGLREFFERMGREAFRGYTLPPTPDELTILHGDDTGVSFGRTIARYRLLGKDYEFESRWTATVVREDDRWLLAGYHISVDLLDNPLLKAAKGGMYVAGGGALAVGIAVGFFIGRRRAANGKNLTKS